MDISVFIPYLDEFFYRCATENGFHTFIEHAPESYLVQFLIKKENLEGSALEEQYRRLSAYLEKIKDKAETPAEDIFAIFA